MAAHSVDAPDGSTASRSSAITVEVASGFSRKSAGGSSDKLCMATISDDIPKVLGGACVAQNKANLAAGSLSIESDIGSLAKLAENQIAPISGILRVLQELTCDIAYAPRQLNLIHGQSGGPYGTNVNSDAAGQDDPPDAINLQAGDIQIAPAYDTVLQLIIDLPIPKQNWIYPDLETV